MEQTNTSYEIIANLISILFVVGILYQYYQYKKKLSTIKELNNLKDAKKLTPQDREYIEQNEIEYNIKAQKTEAFVKLSYPIFILTIGIIYMSVADMTQFLILLNPIIVIFIYINLLKLHVKNFAKFLKEIKENK